LVAAGFRRGERKQVHTAVREIATEAGGGADLLVEREIQLRGGRHDGTHVTKKNDHLAGGRQAGFFPPKWVRSARWPPAKILGWPTRIASRQLDCASPSTPRSARRPMVGFFPICPGSRPTMRSCTRSGDSAASAIAGRDTTNRRRWGPRR